MARKKTKGRARCKVRKLTAKDVTFHVIAEREQVDVEGNAIASDDAEADAAYVAEILDRLSNGDTWAWAAVTVEARWGDYVGSDHLGCCSYRDEAAFKAPDGYYPQMCEDALADLNSKVREAAADLAELVEADEASGRALLAEFRRDLDGNL